MSEPEQLLDSRSYTMKLKKGYYYNKPLVAWAAVDKCNADRCRVVAMCSYEQSSNGRNVKCGVQRSYIQTVSEMIHQSFHLQIKNDQQLLFRIGMHLIPLYKTLCKLKMAELAISDPVFTTIRGDRKADPVYREIRETVKLIMMCWKDLGLQGSELGGIEPSPRGDTDYEAELFEEEPETVAEKTSNPPAQPPKLDIGFLEDDD